MTLAGFGTIQTDVINIFLEPLNFSKLTSLKKYEQERNPKEQNLWEEKTQHSDQFKGCEVGYKKKDKRRETSKLEIPEWRQNVPTPASSKVQRPI